jgi:hypothetical protein
MYRKALGIVMISLAHFQSFDRGEVVEESIVGNHELNEGDTFEWQCAQFGGIAKVVNPGNFENGRTYPKIQKVS